MDQLLHGLIPATWETLEGFTGGTLLRFKSFIAKIPHCKPYISGNSIRSVS